MTVARVATLSDGGIRVTLDMSENAVMQMAQFVECKRFGAVLKAEFEPMVEEKQEDDKQQSNHRKIHI